jgi:membrane-bound metal-dependent hydrolase YbcI (DUF457 family)
MPSPLGHVLAGTVVYFAVKRKQSRGLFLVVVSLLASLVPDLDFLPGLWVGKFSAFHHGATHSFAFAILFGLVVFFSLKYAQPNVAKQAAILASVSYAVHVILDFLGANEGTRGVPLFWPVSGRQFGVNLHLLGYFYYSDTGIWSVVRWDNVPALLRELLIIGSPLLVLLSRERRFIKVRKES